MLHNLGSQEIDLAMKQVGVVVVGNLNLLIRSLNPILGQLVYTHLADMKD